MTRLAHLLPHLSVPLLFALAGLVFALRLEPLTGELLVVHLLWGTLFYAAPHLLWGAVCAAFRPAGLVSHAGFAAASCALLVIGGLSVWGPRDPSGLPYQWLAYWPLAGLLLAVVFVVWCLAKRPNAGT